MTSLRPFEPSDLDALYTICLETGNNGGDGTSLYQDPRLIGEIYAAPYALIEGGLVMVAVEAGVVTGYAAGVVDTAWWEERLENVWWPHLRRRHPVPGERPDVGRTWDQRRIFQMHSPGRTPEDVVQLFPSHVHMNLRAVSQKRGVGSALLAAWLHAASRRGAKACHVGVNRSNLSGEGFWRARGFEEILRPGRRAGRTLWMGRSLDLTEL